MSIESEADWRGLRQVGRIVRLTLDALEKGVKAGITTADLDRVAAEVFARFGARSAPAFTYDFPGTVLISVNSEIVHGIPGAHVLAKGDVVKLDVTAEKDGYIADAARTVVVGNGSAVANRLINCAKTAFARALAVTRAGTPVREIGRAVSETVREHGFSVVPGLDGHGTGRRIHEPPAVPNTFHARQRDVLTEGLVLTIEPIISVGDTEAVEDDDGWTVRTADGSLAAHYEHTLVVTRGRPIILTAA
jgi:methionyl aminopeptidase